MKFANILHILTVMTAALFAWKPKAEIGAILFVLLMIEGAMVKMSKPTDSIPTKSKIKDYFDSVWKRKRTKFQSVLFYVPAFIWFMFSWFFIPQLIIERFNTTNLCSKIIDETGNFFIDFAAQMACTAEVMVIPFFIIATTAIILFATGIWILSKIENLYLHKQESNVN